MIVFLLSLFLLKEKVTNPESYRDKENPIALPKGSGFFHASAQQMPVGK
jgi:hypothetical protein